MAGVSITPPKAEPKPSKPEPAQSQDPRRPATYAAQPVAWNVALELDRRRRAELNGW